MKGYYLAAFFMVAVTGGLSAQAPLFEAARVGCPMAHCDPRMSDMAGVSPPTSANPIIRFHDTLPSGSGKGLACSSNGMVVACSYNDPNGDNLVAYRADGSRLWSSGSLFSTWSFTSAPLLNTRGGVIFGDENRLVRFSPTGGIVWNVPTPSGVPISPLPIGVGHILLATYGGPVSIFDGSDGRLVGSLLLKDSPADPEFFHTTNTPCILGNRVYISTMLRNDPANTARLVALEVDPANADEPIRIAWHFTFGGPSGGSPLCINNTVYFDGDRLGPGEPKNPHLFAVRDDGAAGTLVWAQPVVSSIQASAARDPRGGLWHFVSADPLLQRRSTATGELIESLDVTTLVDDPNPNVPNSALTIAGSAARPILILGTFGLTDVPERTAYVIAIDLVARQTLWKVNIRPTLGADRIVSQFPIVLDQSGKPVVVFSGWYSGAYFLADP